MIRTEPDVWDWTVPYSAQQLTNPVKPSVSQSSASAVTRRNPFGAPSLHDPKLLYGQLHSTAPPPIRVSRKTRCVHNLCASRLFEIHKAEVKRHITVDGHSIRMTPVISSRRVQVSNRHLVVRVLVLAVLSRAIVSLEKLDSAPHPHSWGLISQRSGLGSTEQSAIVN